MDAPGRAIADTDRNDHPENQRTAHGQNGGPGGRGFIVARNGASNGERNANGAKLDKASNRLLMGRGRV